jgi:hypothetical protein
MLPELTQPEQGALRAVFDRFRRDAGLMQLPPPPPPPPPAPPEPAEPCRCGCVALRIRNAHLEDQVHRLVAVLGPTGGALDDDEADRRRAADRDWPAWFAGHDLGPERAPAS